MANVGTAYVTIAPSMKGFASKTSSLLNGQAGTLGSSAGSTFSNKFQSSGSGKIGTAMGAIAGVAGAVATTAFNAIGVSMGAAISRVDQLNNFPKVMQNLGYSSEDASRSIQNMSNAIDGLPTSLDTLSNMTQQLAPLCSNLDEATNISIALNNAMLAGGKGSAEVSRAMTQYTQALSKGKPDLMDWRTLQEVMPGQLNQIAQAMLGAGKNSNDLYTELKNGTVTMTDFNNAVLKLNSEGFDGFASFEQQARDATQGIGTALTNIQNRIAKAGETIINAFGATRISGAINAFSSSFGVIAKTVAPAFTLLGNIAEKTVTLISSRFSFLSGLVSTVLSPLQSIPPAFSFIGDYASRYLEKVINKFSEMRQKSEEVYTAIANVAKTKVEAFASSIVGFAEPLQNSLQPLKKIATDTATSMTIVFKGFFNRLKSGSVNLTNLGDAFHIVFGNVKNEISQTPIAQYISSMVSGFGTIDGACGNFINQLKDGKLDLTSLVGAVTELGQNIASSFDLSKPTEFFNGIKNGLSSLGASLSSGSFFANLIVDFDALPERLQTFLSTLDSVFASIGQKAQSIKNVLSSAFGGIIESIQAKFQSGLPTIDFNSVFTVALAGLDSFVSKLTPIVTFAESVFSSLWNAIQTVAIGIQSAFSSVSIGDMGLSTVISLISPIGQISLALQQIGPQLATIVDTILQSLAGSIVAILPTLLTIIDAVMNLAMSILPVLVSLFLQMLPFVQQLFTFIGQLTTTLMPFISTLISVLVPAIQQILGALSPLLSAIMNLVQTVLPLVTPILEVIIGLITALLPILTLIVTTVINVISAVIGNVAMIISVVEPIISFLLTGIGQLLSHIGQILSVVASVVGGVITFLASLWANWRSTIESIVNAVTGFISSVVGFFTGLASSIISTVTTMWNNVVNGFSDGVTNAVNFVKDLPNQIIQFFSNAGTWLVESGKSIINGFIDGIKGAIGGAIDTVTGFVGQIRDLFPFSPAKTGPFSGHGWVIYSGMSIMNALAEGVEKRAGATVRTVKGVMQDVANTASVNAGMNLAYEAGASLNLARSNLASMTSSQANTTERVIQWLDNNLGSIINQNAPQTVIDNDAGAMIVDNRLVQLQRKAGMNRG